MIFVCMSFYAIYADTFFPHNIITMAWCCLMPLLQASTALFYHQYSFGFVLLFGGSGIPLECVSHESHPNTTDDKYTVAIEVGPHEIISTYKRLR